MQTLVFAWLLLHVHSGGFIEAFGFCVVGEFPTLLIFLDRLRPFEMNRGVRYQDVFLGLV